MTAQPKFTLADKIAESAAAHPLGLPDLTYFGSFDRPLALLDWLDAAQEETVARQMAVGRAFWQAFGRFWTVCDGVDHEAMGEAMQQQREWRDPGLFSDEDRAFLDALPNPVLIFRGQHEPEYDDVGISWTTNRDTARWFAEKGLRGVRGDRQVVLAMVVHKHEIAFASDARGEAEVVLWLDAAQDGRAAIVERIAPSAEATA